MHINELSGTIIEAAIAVHRALGPGLLESVYQAVLVHELRKRGLKATPQEPVSVTYETVEIEIGFIADVVVEDTIVLELKSVEKIIPVHKKQLLTYLRLMDKRLGLLINFNEVLLVDGITRIVNGLEE